MDKYEKKEVIKDFDHLNRLKFSKVPPTAFTERGLYMLTPLFRYVNWLVRWSLCKMLRDQTQDHSTRRIIKVISDTFTPYGSSRAPADKKAMAHPVGAQAL